LIPETELDDRRISSLELSDDVNLADCTSSLARVFGITAEVHSTEDYPCTQRWAAALFAAGFGGIQYFLRHDPGQHCSGVALFGPAGVADYPCPLAEPVGPEILEKAKLRFGLEVAPPFN